MIIIRIYFQLVSALIAPFKGGISANKSTIHKVHPQGTTQVPYAGEVASQCLHGEEPVNIGFKNCSFCSANIVWGAGGTYRNSGVPFRSDWGSRQEVDWFARRHFPMSV